MQYVRQSILSFILLVSHFFGYNQDTVPSEKIIRGRAQGTSYLIRYFATGQDVLAYQIDSILSVLDASLSLYKKDSYISSVNKRRKSTQGDEHLLNVLTNGLRIQKASEGVFDVRLYALSQAWGFGPNPAKRIPSNLKIQRVRPSIRDSVWIDGIFIRKSSKKIKIDLDGLAQGYSVDVLSNFLSACGIRNFTVELGGEIRTSGVKPNSGHWKIGIESPVDPENTTTLIVAMKDEAITTSGTYRKTRTFRGKTYSHILDPRTARPLQNKMISCTVVAPSAMMADALDNIGMILGPISSIPLFTKLGCLSAHFVWMEGDGSFKSLSTPGFTAMKSL